MGGKLMILVNGSDRPADVSCWTVKSASGRSARISIKAPLAPGASLRLIPEAPLFETVDTLSLLDRQGQVVDRTPQLSDRAHDDQIWFRQPNGTWTFGRGFPLPGQLTDGRLVAGDNC